MFFRRRKEGLPPANVGPDWLSFDEWLDWEAPRNVIVGESQYREALRRLAGPPRHQGYLIPVEVEMIRDPTNPHDPNAIRAVVGGMHVGYLGRRLAEQIAPAVDSVGCKAFTVCGIVRGGLEHAPDLGVHAWLGRRRSPGPDITLLDDFGEVANWPPGPEEG